MLILLLHACLLSTNAIVVDLEQCEVDITLGVPSASAGDTLTLGGGPFTEPYDTSVLVDGEPSEVLDVVRESCSDCDTCRVLAECTECGPCSSCEETCRTCRQTVDFVVPELAPGDVSVVLVNHYATSNAVDLTIESASE